MKRLVKKPVVTEKVVEKVVTVENEIVEENSQEFVELLGKNVCVFCAIYIYAGTLVGVNGRHIVLENAGIVYETGDFSAPKWKDFQSLPAKEVKIRTDMIESYFEVVRK